MSLMARGDKKAKEGFAYKTIQGCRQITQKFIKNKLIREKLLRYVRDEMITGYQLQDILRDNLTYDAIRDKVIERQKHNYSRFTKRKDPRVIASNIDIKFMKAETDEEKEVRYGNPDYDIVKLLEEFKVENVEEKLKKHEVTKELFWELNEGELGTCFDIEKFGTKRRLIGRINDLKEEHRKKME